MKRLTILTGEEIAELYADEMIEFLENAKREYPGASIFFERGDTSEDGVNVSLIVALRG